MKCAIQALLLCLISGTAFAQQSDCQSPLIYAGRDNDQQAVEKNFVSYAYNNFCSAKSSKAGLNFDSSSTAIIDFVPIKSALSFGGRKEKAEQFCKEQSDFQNDHVVASRNSSIVVREALQAFNVCKAMEAAKVRMNFDLGTRGFAIKVARGSADANFEGVVITPATAAACSMTKVDGSGASLVDVGPATFFPLTGNEVAITCEKNISNGIIPEMEVQIKTSEKSMRLAFERDFEYTPQYASQMREAMNQSDAVNKSLIANQLALYESIGTVQTEKPKPIVMTGGKGWDKLERCPAGHYVAGVGAHGGGGGKYCYNCVETVKFICEPFRPAATAQ